MRFLHALATTGGEKEKSVKPARVLMRSPLDVAVHVEEKEPQRILCTPGKKQRPQQLPTPGT